MRALMEINRLLDESYNSIKLFENINKYVVTKLSQSDKSNLIVKKCCMDYIYSVKLSENTKFLL